MAKKRMNSRSSRRHWKKIELNLGYIFNRLTADLESRRTYWKENLCSDSESVPIGNKYRA